MEIRARQREDSGDLQCLYCMDTVAEEGLARCDGCRAVYHSACVVQELHGVCGTPGCAERVTAPARFEVEARAAASETSELIEGRAFPANPWLYGIPGCLGGGCAALIAMLFLYLFAPRLPFEIVVGVCGVFLLIGLGGGVTHGYHLRDEALRFRRRS